MPLYQQHIKKMTSTGCPGSSQAHRSRSRVRRAYREAEGPIGSSETDASSLKDAKATRAPSLSHAGFGMYWEQIGRREHLQILIWAQDLDSDSSTNHTAAGLECMHPSDVRWSAAVSARGGGGSEGHQRAALFWSLLERTERLVC